MQGIFRSGLLVGRSADWRARGGAVQVSAFTGIGQISLKR
jgi:hypothetical protein